MLQDLERIFPRRSIAVPVDTKASGAGASASAKRKREEEPDTGCAQSEQLSTKALKMMDSGLGGGVGVGGVDERAFRKTCQCDWNNKNTADILNFERTRLSSEIS